MSEEILSSELFLSLEKLEKDKGYITLVDIITAKKSYGQKGISNEDIIEALKSKGLNYVESDDDSDDFVPEPTEADLNSKDNDLEDMALEDEFDEFDDVDPTIDELNEIEKEVDGESYDNNSQDKDKNRSDDEDDEEEIEEEEEYPEDNMNEWKGTDEDVETSERFIDISSFSESSQDHRSSHQSSSKYDTSQDDPIRLYLKEIGNEKLLTGEQEVELAKRMEKGAKIVNSVIRESGILISFFANVIKQINTKIDEESEDTLSPEDIKEFLSIQKRYNLNYKDALGKDFSKTINEYNDDSCC